MAAPPSIEVLRAFWAARQGLDGSLAGATAAETLDRVGWARSVGGTTPYLTLRSRAGLPRAVVDAAVADLSVHELPSARDCTYVLPAADFALAPVVGGGAASRAELRTAERLGVTRLEVDRLAHLVESVLAEGGDADPATLRKALGDNVRSLGEEGRKKGITTTLPLALGLLQADSRVRRVPVGGRLDQQRFRYTRWPDAPRWTGTEQEAGAALAERYWRWTGVASLAQFRWFSGFTAGAARAAVAHLGLVPVPEVDGAGPDLMGSPGSVEALASTRVPDDPAPAFVGWLDSVVLLRRDLTSLVDPADRPHPLLAASTRSGGALGDLPHQGVVDRGRVVGLWDYDPEAGELVATLFASVEPLVRTAVEEERRRTEAYVRDELGDNRGMSLDSPASRRSRLAALRTATA